MPTYNNRAIDKSFNGILVIEFNFNQEYLTAYNHSHMYGYALRERDLEAKALKKRDIERKGKASWHFMYSEMESNLNDHYQKIQLSKSGIIAYVRVTGILGSQDFSQGASSEFNRKILIKYLIDNWEVVQL